MCGLLRLRLFEVAERASDPDRSIVGGNLDAAVSMEPNHPARGHGEGGCQPGRHGPGTAGGRLLEELHECGGEVRAWQAVAVRCAEAGGRAVPQGGPCEAACEAARGAGAGLL